VHSLTESLHQNLVDSGEHLEWVGEPSQVELAAITCPLAATGPKPAGYAHSSGEPDWFELALQTEEPRRPIRAAWDDEDEDEDEVPDEERSDEEVGPATETEEEPDPFDDFDEDDFDDDFDDDFEEELDDEYEIEPKDDGFEVPDEEDSDSDEEIEDL
jgi:hypothetical protein